MCLNVEFLSFVKYVLVKLSNNIIFSPFKTEWKPGWDASMPRAEFPRILEYVAGL